MTVRSLLTTASLVAIAAVAPGGSAAAGGIGSCRLTPRHFRTLPDVHTAPFCVIRHPAPGTAPGLLLVTPRPGRTLGPGQQWSAMILTDAGRVVWYTHRPNRVHDLMMVRYRGRRLLAFYERSGQGWFELLDAHYRTVARIAMGGGYRTDMHELQLTDRGTAYMDSYHPVEVAGVGRVMDWVMREVDIATGKVLFEWHALRHVPLSASYRAQQSPAITWDFFHGNSIDPPRRGDHVIVVSSRNTSAVYGIDRRTGRVLWVLGGKRDQFGLRRHPGWWFCGQHDARRLPDGTLTLFDDGGSGSRDGTGCGPHPARVPRFRLDVRHRRVRLVSMVRSGPSSPDGRGFMSSAVGSARVQPNGDTLVSWGTSGFISEVAPSGSVRSALRLRPWTYRAIRARWRGLPDGRPAIAVDRARRRADVWVSWNGATEVRQWCALGSDSGRRLRSLDRCRPFAGFETHLGLPAAPRCVAIVAVGTGRRELGTSEPACAPG